MNNEIIIEFPLFPTHVATSRLKWQKISFNTIYASPHYTMRNRFISVMHSFAEQHIPPDLKISGPVKIHLEIHAPINFGNVKSKMNKELRIREISWKKPTDDYEPNWDIGNLSMLWDKCLTDAIVHAGILPDDNVKHIVGGSYEFVEVDHLDDRKLVYKIIQQQGRFSKFFSKLIKL